MSHSREMSCSESPWQQLCEAGGLGLSVSGVGTFLPKCPFSLPFSLPSGNSSKKPTRECEPLSEPKVTPACLSACLRLSLCRGLGAGAAAEHGASPPRRTFLLAWAAAPRLTLGLWTQNENKGASRGLDWTAGRACGLGLRVHGAPPGMPVNSPRSWVHICSVHVNGIEAESQPGAGPALGQWSEHRSGMLHSRLSSVHPFLSDGLRPGK